MLARGRQRNHDSSMLNARIVIAWFAERPISMGDKSPKDKNKKQSQKSAASDKVKGAKQKHQESLDHAPKKAK